MHILCEKFASSEFFWSVFSRIRTEYGEILRIRSIQTRTTLNTFHVVYSVVPKVFVFVSNFSCQIADTFHVVYSVVPKVFVFVSNFSCQIADTFHVVYSVVPKVFVFVSNFSCQIAEFL